MTCVSRMTTSWHPSSRFWCHSSELKQLKSWLFIPGRAFVVYKVKDATRIESTTQTLNLQQFLSLSYSENITVNSHLPQAVPVKEMEKLLLSAEFTSRGLD